MNPIGNTFTAADGASIGVYRADPPGPSPRPGLLVVPSIFGISDEIASAGVVVVAFDPFARGDDPGVSAHTRSNRDGPGPALQNPANHRKMLAADEDLFVDDERRHTRHAEVPQFVGQCCSHRWPFIDAPIPKVSAAGIHGFQ